jgi:hypothetical protein
MKKSLFVLSLIVVLGASACGRRYTCPTYLKNTDNPKDTRVKVEEPKTEKKEIKG